MTPTRRLLLGAGAALAAAPVLAQGSRNLSLIVPAPPGGTTDIAARLAAEGLTTRHGYTAVVDNRPGGNGVVAARAVTGARPDGTTLFVGFSGFMSAIPALITDLGVDTVADFTPVAMLLDCPHVLVVPSSLPVRNVPDFVAYARAQRGAVNYGSVGVGSIHHLGMELLARRLGFEATHIPYRGTAPAVQDLLAGRVQAYFTSAPAVSGMVRDGRLRALFVAASARLGPLPEVPDAAEAGLPGLAVSSWYALFAPTATPAPVIEALGRATREVVATPNFQERAAEQGGFAPPTPNPEITARIRAELAEWREVVRAGNIRADG